MRDRVLTGAAAGLVLAGGVTVIWQVRPLGATAVPAASAVHFLATVPDDPLPSWPAADPGSPAASPPVAVSAPDVGLRARVVPVGLRADGSLDVPPASHTATAGWFRSSAVPGGPGAAVIVGHVDSASDGPAVFWGVSRLRPGAHVSVELADGVRVAYSVTRVARVPKRDFPSGAVYGRVPRAELRLVTCGGPFDRRTHSYRDNVIAFATMIPPDASPPEGSP